MIKIQPCINNKAMNVAFVLIAVHYYVATPSILLSLYCHSTAAERAVDTAILLPFLQLILQG